MALDLLYGITQECAHQAFSIIGMCADVLQIRQKSIHESFIRGDFQNYIIFQITVHHSSLYCVMIYKEE